MRAFVSELWKSAGRVESCERSRTNGPDSPFNLESETGFPQESKGKRSEATFQRLKLSLHRRITCSHLAIMLPSLH